MKTIKIELNLYEFYELSEEAKNKVVNKRLHMLKEYMHERCWDYYNPPCGVVLSFDPVEELGMPKELADPENIAKLGWQKKIKKWMTAKAVDMAIQLAPYTKDGIGIQNVDFVKLAEVQYTK